MRRRLFQGLQQFIGEADVSPVRVLNQKDFVAPLHRVQQRLTNDVGRLFSAMKAILPVRLTAAVGRWQ